MGTKSRRELNGDPRTRHARSNLLRNADFDRETRRPVLAWIRSSLRLDDGRTKTWAPEQDIVEGECVRCPSGTTCKAMRSVPAIVTVIALQNRAVRHRLLANTAVSLPCAAGRAKRGHRRNSDAVSGILSPCVAGLDWARHDARSVNLRFARRVVCLARSTCT